VESDPLLPERPFRQPLCPRDEERSLDWLGHQSPRRP
jgi:hypothetical protein